jgi:hypothetical protein
MQTGKGVGEGAKICDDICVWAAKILEKLIALRVKKVRKTLFLFLRGSIFMKNTVKSCRLLNFFKYFFGGENPSLLILLLYLV